MQNKTARSWCFTSYANDLDIDTTKIKYGIAQREVCPTTNREHWQGYFSANNAIRFKAAKAIVRDNSAHVEPAKGTADQNYVYCTKLDSRKPDTQPWEFGSREALGQGKR